MKTRIVCSLLSVVSLNAYAFKWHYVEPNQWKKGHLALATSQEVGPLYAFGQNIVDKGNKQLFAYENALLGNSFSLYEVRPSFLYGITDYFSLFVELPITALYAADSQKKAGVQNITFQFEGAVIDYNTVQGSYQLTLVANVAIPISNIGVTRPTGSSSLLGSDSTSFLAGATACYMGIDWYFFTCQGGIFSLRTKNTQAGSSYLYQFGASRCVSNYADWIFACMVELFGSYTQRSTMRGVIDNNSGGNVVYLGPSLWVSSNRFIGQIGFAVPIAQTLFGNQQKTTWFPALDLGWKF